MAKNYLYFASNLVTVGGHLLGADRAILLAADDFINANPVSATSTALYFKDPLRLKSDRVKILLKHGNRAAGGGFKNVMRALSQAMKVNGPNYSGFIVFADEEADNATITGAANKEKEFFSAYDKCVPDSSTLTEAAGAVVISKVKDDEELSGISGAGVTSTDVGLPKVSVKNAKGKVTTTCSFSLVGLKASGTTDDVIGVGTDQAHLFQYDLATMGKIVEAELTCHTQAANGGTTDINIVYNSASRAEDGAGGTTFGVNAGVLAAGASATNTSASATDNDFIYITDGSGDGNDTAFNAGSYTLELRGILS